jgi:hypothetical protein
MSKAYKSEPKPRVNGNHTCFSRPREKRRSTRPPRRAPAARPRRLAIGRAPASARCVAPHQPRAGLRPLGALRALSGGFAAARCLAPLLWPLPRGLRVCAPFGPRCALGGAPCASTVALCASRPLSVPPPAVRLVLAPCASAHSAAATPAPPQAHTAPPPAAAALPFALAHEVHGPDWGSAPNPALRRARPSGGTIRKRSATPRGCDGLDLKSRWYSGGISALPDGVKFKSALLTQASGSIGGMTASRNRGGLFLRSRVIPVNPNTERQGEARANMAQAVGAWSNTLNDSERQGWNTYANGTPVVDALGDQLILSGQQMFIKCMLPRLVAGLAIISAAPITAGLATTPLVTIDPEWDVSSNLTASITVPASATSGDLNVYVSEPTSPSRTVAHAKRAWAALEGPPVASVFTVSIAAGDLPYSGVTGAQARVTFVYLSDDGRVSAEVFRDLVITGA